MDMTRSFRCLIAAAPLVAAIVLLTVSGQLSGLAAQDRAGETGAATAASDQAADPQAARQESEQALEAIRRDIEAQKETEAALAAEIEELGDDRAALTERMISTAARVKDIEASVGRVENRLSVLGDREDALRASFRERSGLLAELLAALQRMGRKPPPAVLVNPDDALKTVRTAIVLGAVLPGLQVETEALASDLQELARLKREIDGEKARLLARTRDLEGERQRISALIEAKRAASAESRDRLDAVRKRAAELSEQAETLQDLIASLDREIAVAEREAAAARLRAEVARRPATAEDARRALSNPARLEPAIAFSTAKGLLPLPVSGAIVREFGKPDEFGSPARGLSVATRSQAQVTAPSDGWVVYAGSFRSYGELLILNAGDGYHVLLAGMDEIAVELGQFVLAGEPVGRMGGLVLASAANVNVGRTQPVLYIEFRKDGRSIDPAPWWAEGRTGVGG